MIVRSPPPERPGFGSRKFRRTKFALGGLLGVLALYLLRPFLLVLPDLGIYLMYQGGYRSQYGETQRARTELPIGLRTWATAVVSPPETSRLALDIKFKHLMRLRARREEALAAGLLVQREDDFVPAVLHLTDRSVEVKLRLKGDLVDHLSSDRWSFRIQVKGDDHVFGMRRFSLQPAAVRDYQAEPLFLEHMRRVGVLAPRYMFVQVRLNGDDLGLMAIEEHFSTELLESQGRKDGVILRFDDSRYWEYLPIGGITFPFVSYATSEVQPFRAAGIRTPGLRDDLRVATGLFRGYMDGTLEASQVFDAKLTGRYLAVVRAWSAWHANLWFNIRFYYNPVTARLEPIAFDAELMQTPPFMMVALAKSMMADTMIRREYESELLRLNDHLVQGGLLQALEDAQDRHLAQLHRQFPWVRPLDLSVLTTAADRPMDRDTAATPAFMRWGKPLASAVLAELGKNRMSEPEEIRADDLVRVHLITDGDDRFLELSNLVPFEVEATLATIVRNYGGSDHAASPASADPPPPMTLPATQLFQVAMPMRVPLPDSAMIDSVFVKRVGGDVGAWVYPTPYFPSLTSNPIPEGSLDAISRHAFLDLDESRRTVTARRGVWDVDGSISLPKGVELILPAGTQLGFEPKAVLVVRGAVRFQGTPAEPVVLRGHATTDGFGPWQGMAVFNEGSEAQWSHVQVVGTTGVDLENWHLTGGVTIYQGQVSISDTEFVGNRAEDALNLIHTSFTLNGTSVRDAISDGIDVDFGSGTVTGGEISGIGWVGGGDAIDFSGATASITGTSFRQIGDKAISVGEGSTVRVSDITVHKAGAGAVVKDGSYLAVDGARMSEISNAALMAYIKKSEYGGAVLEAYSVSSSDVSRLAHVQVGNILRIDGEGVAGEDIDVDSLYATVMRRGAR